jgi:hypothetical protein
MVRVAKKKNTKGIKIKGITYSNRKEYWKSKKTHKFDIKDAFYKEHFRTPRDEITQRFKAVMQTPYYKQMLPDIIQQGLANLQEKEEYKQKTIPLFSLIKTGAYEKEYANYDVDNTKDNINFFLNNLPSFKQYRKHNKLDWIIDQHRLLALEIFEYYTKNENGVSPSTLGARFNIILRVMRIAYDNKKAPIYKLYSTIVFAFKNIVSNKEGENQLNRYEKDKFIHWEDVLHIQKTMQSEFNAIKNKKMQTAYDLNNDLLLISIYSLFPPERNENKFLEFSRHPRKNDKDYVYVSKNMDRVVLKFNDMKKQHDPIQFDLSKGEYKNEMLSNIITESLSLYPRDYLFTLKKKYPDVSQKVTKRGLDERLYTIFFKYGIKNKVSVNSLRSSYITHILSNPATTYNDKLALAHRMRTSLHCLELYYNKVQTNKPILNCKPNDKKCMNDKKCVNNLDDSSDSSDNDNDNDSDNDNDNDNDNENDNDNDIDLDNIDYDNDNDNNNDDNYDNDNDNDNYNDNNNDDNYDNDNDNDNDNNNISNRSDKSNSSNQSDRPHKSNRSDRPKTSKKNSMVDCIIKCCEKNKKTKEGNVDNDDETDKPTKFQTQYKRKLLKAKEWYVQNREEVIEKTREYKEKMTPFEKTRERICQLLNASPDYAEKIRAKTVKKYKYYYNETTKKWTWEGKE